MSRSDAVVQAERDCRSLFRKRDALLAALDRIEAAPAAEQKELALQLSLAFPGVRSVGYLAGVAPSTRLQVLSLLGDERRDFVERLLQRVPPESPTYQALGQALPLSFPAPKMALEGRAPSAPEVATLPAGPLGHAAEAAEAVEPKLAALILRLREGPPPSLPPLARPVSGELAGVPVEEDPGLSLELQPDGSLRIWGTTDVMLRMSAQEKRADAPGERRAVLKLADGSMVEADEFFLRGSRKTISSDPPQRTTSWHGQLFGWRWWRSKKLRFWVASEEDGELPPTRNLAINDGAGTTLVGILIPGRRPAAFLSSRKERGVLQVYRAGPFPMEERARLVSHSAAVLCALMINTPRLFFGYDEHMNIAACMEGGWRPANKPGVGFTPSAGLFVPSLPGDWRVGRHDVWQVPFLEKLFQALESWSSPVRDAIDHLRTILYEPVIYQQIAMLGTVIRIILVQEGDLRGDDFLLIDKVQSALNRFSGVRGLDLPGETAEALALAHRVALLGERAMAPRRPSAQLDDGEMGRLEKILNALRCGVASMIGALIDYRGPLFAGLAADGMSSLAHLPFPVSEEDRGTAERSFVIITPLSPVDA